MKHHRLLMGLAALAWLGLLAGSDGALARTQSPANVAVQQQAGPSLQGDVDCSGAADSVDALQVLRSVARLSVSADCLDDAGDVDCSTEVNSVDALKILRYVARLPNDIVENCPAIGEPLAGPPTSEALIAEALEADDITYEESLLYRALALYDSPGLPDEFRSPVMDLEAAIRLFGEVEENRAQLSQGLLDNLAPFMARPNDPVSIFNNPPVQTTAVSAAAGAPWVDEPAAGGAARVWMKDRIGAPAELTAYAAAVSKVWTAFPGIFRYPNPDQAGDPSLAVNPDSAIDFYFVSASEIDPRQLYCVDHPDEAVCKLGTNNGYAQRAPKFEGNTSSSYLVMSDRLAGDQRLDTVAHELAHASQFAYDKEEGDWLIESTAEWVAYRVLKKLGLSQPYAYPILPPFFKTLDQPLTSLEGLNEYASWLYFLFASMETSDGIVTSIWQQAAADGKQNEEAVNQVFPFADNFDDFAVRNWNKKPPLVKTYRDAGGDPTFPQGLAPQTKPWLFTNFFEEERTESDAINPLASIYYQYKFIEPIRKIKFTNLIMGNPNARIWALLKVGDDWKAPLELTNTAERIFCRDLANDNVTELVIIVSNTHMTTPLAGSKFKLKTETASCHGWVGTAKGTYENDSGYFERGITTANALWEEDFFLFGCNCRTFFPTGSISWSWDYSDPGANPPCSDRGSAHESAGGQGAHKAEQMLTLWQDPANENRYYYSATGVSSISRMNACGGSAAVPAYIAIADPNITLPSPSPFPIPTFPAQSFPFSQSSPDTDSGPSSKPQLGAAAGSNLCADQTFTITKDTVFFSGNCYESQDDTGYLKYEWSFSRVNVAVP